MPLGTFRRVALPGLGLALGAVACGSNSLQAIGNPGAGGAGASSAAPQGGAGGHLPVTTASTGDAGVPRRDAGTTGCKRGIGANTAPGAAFAPGANGPGVWWWYNWSASGPEAGAGIEFVPMFWGGGSLSASVPANANYVLGFNEPNFKSQANLTASQAAADWPQIQAKAGHALLVSPAVNFCGSPQDTTQCSDPAVTDPYTYLKDFFTACPACQVDAIAVHWYNCDLASLKAYLEGNTSTGGNLPGFVQFNKPIWLTEFSCDGSATVAQQKAYMQVAIPYLEQNPHIFRYAWFSASNIPNALLANSDGSPTDLGKTYASLPQGCP